MNSNKVVVKDGDIDKALRRFKVVVAKSGREEKKKNIRNSRKHRNN